MGRFQLWCSKSQSKFHVETLNFLAERGEMYFPINKLGRSEVLTQLWTSWGCVCLPGWLRLPQEWSCRRSIGATQGEPKDVVTVRRHHTPIPKHWMGKPNQHPAHGSGKCREMSVGNAGKKCLISSEHFEWWGTRKASALQDDKSFFHHIPSHHTCQSDALSHRNWLQARFLPKPSLFRV